MIQIFLMLHLVSLVLLAGVSAAALAAPAPERRRAALMASGVLALVVFVSGFGLLGLLRLPFQGWVVIKLAAWLALGMIAPLAFRRPGRAPALAGVAVGAVVVGVVMVVLKPF